MAEETEGEEQTEEESGPPEPDPATCKAIALCQEHLEESILDGEWTESPYLFYLEPAGVMRAELHCTRCADGDRQRAGLFMTRAAWLARKAFLDDDLNPDSYELSFPKEYGYIKSRQHYDPSAREHAKYPWTKKY